MRSCCILVTTDKLSSQCLLCLYAPSIRTKAAIHMIHDIQPENFDAGSGSRGIKMVAAYVGSAAVSAVVYIAMKGKAHKKRLIVSTFHFVLLSAAFTV